MSINPKRKTVIGIIAAIAAIIGAVAAVAAFLKRKSNSLCGCSDHDGNVYGEDEDDYMEDYHYISEDEEDPGEADAEEEESAPSEETQEDSADPDADWEKDPDAEEE